MSAANVESTVKDAPPADAKQPDYAVTSTNAGAEFAGPTSSYKSAASAGSAGDTKPAADIKPTANAKPAADIKPAADAKPAADVKPAAVTQPASRKPDTKPGQTDAAGRT